jgi:phospholipase D
MEQVRTCSMMSRVCSSDNCHRSRHPVRISRATCYPFAMRFVIALLLVFANTQSVLATQPVAAKVSVCFTPSEQCEDRIVAEIDRARASIRVQAYGFTSLPIIHALQRAAGRGVEVLAILDKTNERKYSGATLLRAAGIPVWIDYMPSIAHNKVILIDESLVIGGAYNVTGVPFPRCPRLPKL